MPLSWDNQTVSKLTKLWAEGLSASQIAQILNGTRSQIIGKIHRLRLTGPNSQNSNRGPRTTRARLRPIAEIPFVPRIVVEIPKPEAIGPENDFPQPGCCRWIDRHPAIQTWRCCGQPGHVKPGSPKVTLPFCEYHWKLAHQPQKQDLDENESGSIPLEDKVDGMTVRGRQLHGRNWRKKAA